MNIPFILWTGCFIEIITYILRFRFGFHSKSIQKKANFPFRIHHMYVGFFLIVFGLFINQVLFSDFILNGPEITILDIGITIVLSDMIHHFSILPLFHQKMDFP